MFLLHTTYPARIPTNNHIHHEADMSVQWNTRNFNEKLFTTTYRIIYAKRVAS